MCIAISAMADTTFVKGNVLLQGNYTSGNFNTYTIGTKADIRYVRNKSVFEAVGNFKYTKIGYITNNNTDSFLTKENEKYIDVSYSRFLTKRLKIITFSEVERSFLRKIDIRYNLGVGAGYKFINTKTTYFDISEVILPEVVIYNSDKYNLTSLRYSTRVKFIYGFGSVHISNITLFQPSVWNSRGIEYSENINIRSITTFDVNIYKSLSIGILDEYILQKYNPLKKRAYDNSMTFYLKLNF